MARRIKGEGTIYQRADGRWVARFNGVSKYAKGKMEALDLLNEMKASTTSEKSEVQANTTIADMIKPWLLLKSHTIKGQSYDRLESTIDCHIIKNIGNMPFEDLTDALFVDRVYNNMQHLRYSSIKKAYDALNACMNYYLAKGDIKVNPIKAMGPPTKTAYETYGEGLDDGAVIAFTKKQKEAFLVALEAKYSTGRPLYSNKDAYILALYTGLRIGELLSLKWANVNLDKKTIRIASTLIFTKDRDPESQTFGRKTFKISLYTKNSKPRRLHLNSRAYEAILRLKTIADAKNSQFVVSSKNGGTIRPNVIEKTFSSICDTAGIELPKGYNVHVLRHTFASMLFAKGVNVKIVSELLGHNNVQITMNTYIDLIQDQNVESIQTIDDDL